MMNEMINKKYLKILPVIFSFFIMGIVDLIGTAINYVKVDFTLNDATANVLSLFCFFCFFLFSIPTGLLMNKIGRKNTVLVSFIFTLLGVILPLFIHRFALYVVAFMLIGIGNTIIQVALNPLLSDVVSKRNLTVSITVGQLLKVISSWLGPNVAAWLTMNALGWKYVFVVYAFATCLAAIWLKLTHIDEMKDTNPSMSYLQVFTLLRDRKILYYFIAILILVGVDVGFSSTFPKYLLEKCASITDISQADQLKSYSYFIMRAVGAFIGSVILLRISEYKFYLVSSLISLIGLILLLLGDNVTTILIGTSIFALGYSNLFALIFSFALKYMPHKANEISALLIVGVSGGCFAFLLGLLSDWQESQFIAMFVLALVWIYIIWLIKPIQQTLSIADTKP